MTELASHPSRQSAVGTPRAILVIDRPGERRDFLIEVLEAGGHSCAIAHDHTSALRQMLMRMPSLVFLSGHTSDRCDEVLAILDRFTRSAGAIPVILTNVTRHSDIAIQAVARGAIGVIEQLWDPVTILRMVPAAQPKTGDRVDYTKGHRPATRLLNTARLALLALSICVGAGLWSTAAVAQDGQVEVLRPAGLERAAQVGLASWYGNEHAGRPMANGVIFDPNLLTAAHRTLPLGTRIRVTHLGSGRSVIVTVTDRGPYVRHRFIDLSWRAARDLGMTRAGLARVKIEIL